MTIQNQTLNISSANSLINSTKTELLRIRDSDAECDIIFAEAKSICEVHEMPKRKRKPVKMDYYAHYSNSTGQRISTTDDVSLTKEMKVNLFLPALD